MLLCGAFSGRNVRNWVSVYAYLHDLDTASRLVGRVVWCARRAVRVERVTEPLLQPRPQAAAHNVCASVEGVANQNVRNSRRRQ